jgi:hypothetical protein
MWQPYYQIGHTASVLELAVNGQDVYGTLYERAAVCTLSMHHKSDKEESRMARRMRVSYAYSLLNDAGPSIDELGTVSYDLCVFGERSKPTRQRLACMS